MASGFAGYKLQKLIHDLQGGALRFYDRQRYLLAHVRLLSEFSPAGDDTAEMDGPVWDAVLRSGTVAFFVAEDRYDELVNHGPVNGPAFSFDHRDLEIGGRVEIKTLRVTLNPSYLKSEAPVAIVPKTS